jgi:hypothetical protein
MVRLRRLIFAILVGVACAMAYARRHGQLSRSTLSLWRPTPRTSAHHAVAAAEGLPKHHDAGFLQPLVQASHQQLLPKRPTSPDTSVVAVDNASVPKTSIRAAQHHAQPRATKLAASSSLRTAKSQAQSLQIDKQKLQPPPPPPPPLPMPTPPPPPPLPTKDKASVSLGADTVLLVMAHNRPQYLERCLRSLVRHHPGGGLLPVLVSEDRDGETQGRQVRQVIEKARERFLAAGAASFDAVVFPHGGAGQRGYARLARHYRWALQQAFTHGSVGGGSGGGGGGEQEGGGAAQEKATIKTARVIVVEEDLEIAPDFFEMFGATGMSNHSPSQMS